MLFHPDGACIFGGSNDLVKVYGWEPSKCFDSVNMGWGKVVDMAIAQTQLVRISYMTHQILLISFFMVL